MIGMGTVVNTLAILAGGCVGLVLRKGLPEKWQNTVMHGIALCVGVIGMQMALKTQNIMIVIASMVIGGIIGEAFDIEDRLNTFGNWVGSKIIRNKQNSDDKAITAIGEGFVAASLVFCVGAMAIVGSLQDGLTGNHTTLYAKATLDGIAAIIFTVNMGVGVLLSAFSVAIYQGSITALAGFLGPYMSQTVTAEVTATGGLLIVAISINMLKIAQIRLGNLLPAIIIAGLIATFVG
ncbi:MAG: DUF554 domain-containing protein [Acidaminococcaceae bacterium]|nr:DUF554 domain-containing protein [Acidaminococcaceae bacterium]MDD4721404.1 DUF554 domain-containing protein [Acidaminococcaceae bacterium]